MNYESRKLTDNLIVIGFVYYSYLVKLSLAWVCCAKN